MGFGIYLSWLSLEILWSDNKYKQSNTYLAGQRYLKCSWRLLERDIYVFSIYFLTHSVFKLLGFCTARRLTNVWNFKWAFSLLLIIDQHPPIVPKYQQAISWQHSQKRALARSLILLPVLQVFSLFAQHSRQLCSVSIPFEGDFLH